MYTGLAGLLDRFLHRLGRVPFLAPLKLGDLIMDMGIAKYTEKGVKHTSELFQFDKVLLELDQLESKVITAGGTLATRRVPLVGTFASKTAAHAQNEAMQSFVDNMFEDTVPPPFQNTELSTFGGDEWAQAFVDEVDVPLGKKNETMQDFTFPTLLPTIESFPSIKRDGLLPTLSRFDGDRVGQRQREMHNQICVMNPPVEGRPYEFHFREYEGDNLQIDASTGVDDVCPGHWHGLFVDGKPNGKGIALFVVSDEHLDWPTGAPTQWEKELQYNGFMKDGLPWGKGDLLYNGKTLYTGDWAHGACASNAAPLLSGKGLSPRFG